MPIQFIRLGETLFSPDFKSSGERIRKLHPEIDRILTDGNGADHQRRVHGERGVEGLLRELAERTRS